MFVCVSFVWFFFCIVPAPIVVCVFVRVCFPINGLNQINILLPWLFSRLFARALIAQWVRSLLLDREDNKEQIVFNGNTHEDIKTIFLFQNLPSFFRMASEFFNIFLNALPFCNTHIIEFLARPSKTACDLNYKTTMQICDSVMIFVSRHWAQKKEKKKERREIYLSSSNELIRRKNCWRSKKNTLNSNANLMQTDEKYQEYQK